ncbi:MAG: flippase [Desulforudis sp.]|nr:MAG: flippase [Desulforudis sp.]
MLSFLQRKYTNLVSDTSFSEILTGTVWALSARLLATGMGLVFSVMVVRFYGAEAMGIVAIIYSFFTLASILTVLGTDTSILRLIPEHLTKYSPFSAFKVYRKTQYMIMGVSLVTGTIFFFSAEFISTYVFSKPHLTFYFALSSVFILFHSMMKLNTEAVRGLRLIKAFSLMLALPQCLNLIFLTLISLVQPTPNAPVYSVLGGFALTGIAGWIIMEYALKKRIKANDSVLPVSSCNILSISLPMLLSAAMTFIISETGILMLGMFRSEEEVGYYAIAIKLASLPAFVLQAINSMAGPKFSELFHSDKIEELFHVAHKSAKLIFFTSVPILIGLVALGNPILRIIFGTGFATAYMALILLAVGQFVNAISGSSGMFLNMTGNQNVLRNIMTLAAVINLSLNFLLIPNFGINGAAFSAMISLCLWNLTTVVYIKIKFGKTTGYVPIFKKASQQINKLNINEK